MGDRANDDGSSGESIVRSITVLPGSEPEEVEIWSPTTEGGEAGLVVGSPAIQDPTSEGSAA